MRTFPIITLVSAIILQTLIIESEIGNLYHSIIVSMALIGFFLLVGTIGVVFIYNRFFRNGKKQN